jgi:hypothetical protein
MTIKPVSGNVDPRVTAGGDAQSTDAISPRGLSRLTFGVFLSFSLALSTAVPGLGSPEAAPTECLRREGATSILSAENRARYEDKLCVTPDEMARYVFLTTSPYAGDSSIAVYRARGRKNSFSGNYWVTATEIEDVTSPRVRVRRYDAPLPESVANVLNELWVTAIKQSRTDAAAVPCAPTGIFSAATRNGVRLRAVTVSLDQDSLCIALMNVGGSLVDYAKLPQSKRPQAAAQIEKESHRLLQRIRP